jgi:hypothetical protein
MIIPVHDMELVVSNLTQMDHFCYL